MDQLSQEKIPENDPLFTPQAKDYGSPDRKDFIPTSPFQDISHPHTPIPNHLGMISPTPFKKGPAFNKNSAFKSPNVKGLMISNSINRRLFDNEQDDGLECEKNKDGFYPDNSIFEERNLNQLPIHNIPTKLFQNNTENKFTNNYKYNEELFPQKVFPPLMNQKSKLPPPPPPGLPQAFPFPCLPPAHDKMTQEEMEDMYKKHMEQMQYSMPPLFGNGKQCPSAGFYPPGPPMMMPNGYPYGFMPQFPFMDPNIQQNFIEQQQSSQIKQQNYNQASEKKSTKKQKQKQQQHNQNLEKMQLENQLLFPQNNIHSSDSKGKSSSTKDNDTQSNNNEKEILTQFQQNNEQNPVQTPIKKTRTCNCKKTKCLKLYCDCFAAGELCGPECNCYGCCNSNQFSDIRFEAIQSILEKQPDAFSGKIQTHEEKQTHKKGCNCRKSGCQKKYCECYSAGVKCSEYCKCEDCKNTDGPCSSHKRQKLNHNLDTIPQSLQNNKCDSTQLLLQQQMMQKQKQEMEMIQQTVFKDCMSYAENDTLLKTPLTDKKISRISGFMQGDNNNKITTVKKPKQLDQDSQSDAQNSNSTGEQQQQNGEYAKKQQCKIIVSSPQQDTTPELNENNDQEKEQKIQQQQDIAV